MDGDPFKAAFKLTKSSGSEVAKETTVSPMTILEILSFNDNATEARTKNSPPTTKNTNPNSIKTITILLFFFTKINLSYEICVELKEEFLFLIYEFKTTF
jgi:hypothetical protein